MGAFPRRYINTTVPSKMNIEADRIDVYKKAERYLKRLIPGIWYNIHDLPHWMATEIIELIDTDEWSERKKTVIGETFTTFKIIEIWDV